MTPGFDSESPRKEDFESPAVASAAEFHREKLRRGKRKTTIAVLVLLAALLSVALFAREWFLLLLAFAAYFLPSLVAGMRDHRNRSAICLVNVLLGWTFVGWVVALVWACMADKK